MMDFLNFAFGSLHATIVTCFVIKLVGDVVTSIITAARAPVEEDL